MTSSSEYRIMRSRNHRPLTDGEVNDCIECAYDDLSKEEKADIDYSASTLGANVKWLGEKGQRELLAKLGIWLNKNS